jgi:hypothetical protein
MLIIISLFSSLTLGIKDAGSLHNPKMFTLRYRFVMMSDVIRYISSSLGTHVSTKFTTDGCLHQEIKTLLQDVDKVYNTYVYVYERFQLLALT